MLLDIELRATKEARQEHELRFARVGQPVALVVHDAQRRAFRLGLDQVVERFHQLPDTIRAADPVIGRLGGAGHGVFSGLYGVQAP